MGKIVKLTETQLKRLVKEMIDANEMALSFDDFKNSDELSDLRNAIDNNKIVSVAFVKKDGTVKHMAIRRTVSAYQFSDRPKSEKQANVESNNNIKKVIDVNFYNKSLKNGMTQSEAAKVSWRSINLETVLGFLYGGKFKDLRDENEIQQRFGEEVYNSLTRNMVRAMAAEQAANQEIVNPEPEIDQINNPEQQ